jgi:tRNA dimethylallyltransferase
MSRDLYPAIVIMGPTASGKSALAIDLARRLQTEIISVDSAQVFREMDIGTAKPSLEEQHEIRHHLIDILDPADSYSTGRFCSDALQIMQQLKQQNKIPILVGGTMLYFNALMYGMAVLPESDPVIRDKLNREWLDGGKELMYQRLQQVDPESALRIHPNDPQRLQRALEVFELTGKPMSAFFNQQVMELPFRPVKLIVMPESRAALHAIIAQRFERMLDAGLIEEVERLFVRGDLSEDLPAIRSVGYRQVWSYLKGEWDKETMIEKGIIATRQLAKRQCTWLRKENATPMFYSEQYGLANQVLDYILPQLE